MKLRLQGNSIRLRLSEADIMQLKQNGQVEETLVFGLDPAQTLRYVLTPTATEPYLTATFSGNTITIFLPEAQATQWVHSDLNGLNTVIDNGHEKGLKIVLEKDLDCWHPEEK